MELKFYNTLSRSQEVFKPLISGSARMYTCGPTVYNYAHIGNFRAYTFEDILRRTLEYFGFTVTPEASCSAAMAEAAVTPELVVPVAVSVLPLVSRSS